MAHIEPNSTIKFMKGVPLDNSYNHTIKFASLSAQQTYFSGTVVKYTVSKATYQRVGKGKLRVEILADNMYDCNYMSFQNTTYGTKWFYAFITNVEYVNDVTCEVTYQIDVMQTYLFDITVGECFVEREHVTDDTIGANTIAEPVDCPDCEVVDGLDLLFTNWHIAVNFVPSFINTIANAVYNYADQVATNIDGKIAGETDSIAKGFLYLVKDMNTIIRDTAHGMFPNNLGEIHENQFTGMIPYVTDDYFDTSIVGNSNAVCQDVQTQIDLMNATGGQVLDVYQVPHEFLIDPDTGKYYWEQSQQEGGNFYIPDSIFTPIEKFSYINSNEYYTPKNNKLYTSPYTYLKVINKQGGEMNLAYEKIQDRHFYFASCFQNGEVMCYMYNVKYGTQGTLSGESADLCRLPMSNFPTCNFNTNGLFSRLTNVISGLSKNLANNLAYRPTVTTTTGESATKNVVKQKEGRRVLSSTITENTEQVNRESVTDRPQLQNYVDQLGELSNNIIGDIGHNSSTPSSSVCDIAHDNFGYSIKVMQITAEYAKIIDNFFERFGYAVKLNKVPNMDTRPHWNYVKTIDAYITGNCPEFAISQIISIFNNGITFWKTPSEVGDYSLDNHIHPIPPTP